MLKGLIERHLTSGFHLMYLGAFCALRIPNVEIAKDLAELTRSDEEATQVISILRNGHDGNRVFPALDWLRGKRKSDVR